jgi:uncharacterized repeat protein (TIGR01451 family)/fimbrial isopeptide formation D2 family protein
MGLAQNTPAGTSIQNQASATYLDSANQPRTTTSNQVVTVVQQVYSFTITPDGTEASPGQTRSNLPGGQVLFQYTVTNNGNGTDTINLTFAQGTSDDFNFDPASVRIYKDDNCNGNVDAGEAQVTSLTLGANGSACVVVVATIPTTATNGQYGNLNLTGASAGSPSVTDTNNWARAVATTQAALTAFKAASPAGSVAPGGTITYTISGSNTGGSPAHAVTSVVTVDGSSKNGILITDVIPSGLTYVSASLSGSAGAGTVTRIYSTNGGTTWTATQPASGVNAVGMLIEGSGAFFPQGASYTLSFQAQVPSGASAGTSYANTATVRYNDGTANQTVTTNSTTNTVGASYNVKVGPYQYPEAGATGSYTVSGYTVNRSGDNQTINPAYSGTEVFFRHTLKNTGNTADSFTLSFSGAPAGWTCQLLANDLTTPLSGTVGPLAKDDTYDFALKCTIPSNAAGSSANITVTATSQSDSSKTDTTQDTVTSVADGFRFDLYGGVDGHGPYTQTRTTDGTNYTSDDAPSSRDISQSGSTFPSANPGAQVVYRLRVENLNFNGLADNYQLLLSGVDTSRIASILFYADATDDGLPDGAPITNTGLVNAGQVFNFLAVVTLKPDAAPGSAGFTFRAKSTQSSAESEDYAYSQVEVNTVAQVLLDPDRSGTVTSPGTIQYTHTLINNSNAPATCNVSGDGGSYGWSYQYSTDNIIWQASLNNVPVAANGGTQTIYVRVQVPAGEPIGRTDVNTVTASCTVNSVSASDTATETTTIVGGELRLQKSAVSYVGSTSTVRDPAGATAYPGDRIVYTITAENIGTGNLTSVKLSDPIPAYTNFVSVSATAAGFSGTYTIRYSTNGTTWSTTAPSSVPTGGVVYVGVDTNGDGTIDANDVMPPGASITITLTVQVQ